MFSFLFGPSKKEKELERENSDLRMKVRRQNEEIEGLTSCLRKRRIELSEHERSLKEILLAIKFVVKKSGLPPVETSKAEAN